MGFDGQRATDSKYMYACVHFIDVTNCSCVIDHNIL